MSIKEEIIYIPLINEGTFVLRPTKAEKINDDIYRILDIEKYDPEDENWKFPPGTIVRCEKEMRNGILLLIAKEKIDY